MINLENSRILITGGTGSFGRALVHSLLHHYRCKSILVFSRDEHKQFKMRLEHPESQYPQLQFCIGDIRDYERVLQASKGIDIIFHLAALKHVHIAEQNPLECIKTNILGSENVIQAALHNQVKKVIALSSDKAAAPHNLYGATKFCADKLFVNAQKYSKDCTFAVLRLGNVVNSRGSVFEIFAEKKDGQHTLYVTHPDATRFIITVEQGIRWLLYALHHAQGGEIYVPKSKSFKISQLVKVIAPKASVVITGLKVGEKLHEHLITETDAYTTAEFNDYYVIYPDHKALQASQGKKLPENFTYHSNQKAHLLSLKALKAILKSQQHLLNN